MTGKRADTFLQLMGLIEWYTLQRAWDELEDEEFFWEPTATAWSVRPREQCQTASPFGADGWVADFEIPEPTPVPMTTIAWLYWHVGSMPARLAEVDFFGGAHAMSSGWASPYLTHHPIFTTAADAAAAMRDGWAALRRVIERTPDDAFEVRSASYTYAPEPPTDGLCVLGPPGPEYPVTFYVAGTLNEISHHASQICTLRDLYAARH